MQGQQPNTGSQNAEAARTLLPADLPEWAEPVAELWRWIESYPLLAFVGVIVLSYLAAKVAEWFLTRGATRLTRHTETEFDDRLIALLHRPIFVTVFFAGLALALRTLELPGGLTETTVRVLKTLMVLVWLGAGFPFLRLLLEALGRAQDRYRLIEERTIPLFDISSKIVLVGGASYAALMIWDVDPTGWLASAGIIGIAVGFAAKDTLANLFAGFFILADAPYKIGDFIILDSGERGRVTHVGIRSTRLETRDDIEITIPNNMIANAKIINESGGKWERERVRIKVGVAYGSDVDRVCEVLERTAVEHEHICADPSPRVRMRGFGDSSLDFELLCWIDEPVLRGRLSHELYMAVYKAFAREGIEIPFPQRDLHVKEMPRGKATLEGGTTAG
jgi:small-conductance mechanosensitive channel